MGAHADTLTALRAFSSLIRASAGRFCWRFFSQNLSGLKQVADLLHLNCEASTLFKPDLDHE